VRVQVAEQHAVFHGFPQQDQRAVFDRGDVSIETRCGELIAARRTVPFVTNPTTVTAIRLA
jgi:hypothetical protein